MLGHSRSVPRDTTVPGPHVEESTPWPPGSRGAPLLIVVGAIGVIASVVVVILGWRLVDHAGNSVATSLELTSDAVATVEETIGLASESLGVATNGIVTLRNAVETSDVTLQNISGVLDSTADTVSRDVPDSLDSIRATMPALVQSAQLLENALGALGFLGVAPPDSSPADAVLRVDQSLEELATRLREESSALRTVADDFRRLSQDTSSITADLESVAANLERTNELLEDYEVTAGGAADLVAMTSDRLDAQQDEARLLVVLIGAILALSHAVPLYLGVSRVRIRPVRDLREPTA